MNEGQKVLRQILGARERLDNEANKYLKQAREEYHRTRQHFASADAEVAPSARVDETAEPAR